MGALVRILQRFIYVMLDPINKHRIVDDFDHKKQMPDDFSSRRR